MNLPLVSIIMPVYNAEKYIRDAIDSILNQTHDNFEYLIIYDHSADNSRDIILSYTDDRIKVLINDENNGLAHALNRGIENCCGKYIIRMDADDISLPDRIEKQVAFMESHPEIGIGAGLTETFGSYTKTAYLPSITAEEVKCSLLFDTAIAHPTVIFRAEILKETGMRYENYIAEDYMMWVAALSYCKIAVFPEIILKYRVTENNLTSALNKKEEQKRETYLKAYEIMLQRCGMKASVENRTLQYLFDAGRLEEHEMPALIKHLKGILDANSRSGYFNSRTLKDVIGKRWIAYIMRNRKYKELFSTFTLYGLRYIIARKINHLRK